MNRALAELRSATPRPKRRPKTPPGSNDSVRRFGDFLAEPSAGQILIVVLTVLLIVAIAFAYALA